MNSLRAETGFLFLRRLTVVNKATDEQMEDVNSTISFLKHPETPRADPVHILKGCFSETVPSRP